MDKCDAELTFDDDGESFVCDRPASRHVIHRDAAGDTAIKVPGGFWTSKN